jgi:uncharacterized protein
MKRCREKLMERRSLRVRPLLDDKILLGWNAMMNQAFSRAYAVTGEQRYLDVARRNMDFLLSAFHDGQDYFHTWKAKAKFPAFLDDLAGLIRALIDLQEVTGDLSLLRLAGEVTETVIRDYQEPGGPFFFYTRAQQVDVILRKKELYDGAVPSGNGMMAWNLHSLGILLDRPEWTDAAADMVDWLHEAITRYPSSFGVWATLLQELAVGTMELVISGPEAHTHALALQKRFIPNRVLMAASQKETGFPLLEGRFQEGESGFWLCRNRVCQKPVYNFVEFTQLIDLELKR